VEQTIRNPRGVVRDVVPQPPGDLGGDPRQPGQQQAGDAEPLGNRPPSLGAENLLQPDGTRFEEQEEVTKPLLPANVGGAVSQVVRPPPPEPEGIEVIRGTDRKFQQIDASGSTRNQPEFSLLPGRTVAESREAAAFGDPSFIAQQESRRGDVQAEAQANQGVAAVVNSVANSGQFGIHEDGTLSFNVIDPATGQYKEVPLSPFVAAAIPDPDVFELTVIDELGTPVLMMFNKSKGTTERVSSKTDLQALITAQFIADIEAGEDSDDTLDRIEEKYGAFFTDFGFLGQQ
jgi:hypothetical protein